MWLLAFCLDMRSWTAQTHTFTDSQTQWHSGTVARWRWTGDTGV